MTQGHQPVYQHQLHQIQELAPHVTLEPSLSTCDGTLNDAGYITEVVNLMVHHGTIGMSHLHVTGMAKLPYPWTHMACRANPIKTVHQKGQYD